ncbi:hypothetical protein PRJBM_01385 [Bartonella henselae]|nr:hypothetical protein Q654_01396 [Bartonella henselae JK 50]ETS07302.1 hypothetical protein Q655_01347 [Bartonella henselae JK 51]CDO40733.1 hypothetical protein PRJBM_01385 [Bartonella henselae]CUH91307.1 hypothetical protein BM1374164_01385 [Bartonella henselae]
MMFEDFGALGARGFWNAMVFEGCRVVLSL